MTPRAPDFVDNETLTGVRDGVNKSFLLSRGAVPNSSLRIFRNGLLYSATNNYSFINGNNIVFGVAPQSTDALQTFYRSPSTYFFLGSGFVDAEIPVGAYDGINANYTLSQVPNPVGSLELYWNGVLLTPGLDYSLFGKVVTMLTLTFPITSVQNPAPLVAYYRISGICGGMPLFADGEAVVPDGIATTFSLAHDILDSSIKVYKNGVFLGPGVNYIHAGYQIQFTTPPLVTDEIVVFYRFVNTIYVDRTQTSMSKTDLMPYMRRHLDDPEARVWQDSTINNFINAGEVDISEQLNIIWIRFAMNILSGVGLYQMPENIKTITRMTYRGQKIDMLTQRQLSDLSPIYRTTSSRPRYASWQFEGIDALRLYPVPNENLPILSDEYEIYKDTNLQNEFVVSAYVYPSGCTTFLQLPDWLGRRTLRLYVLWKCYAMEGPGQSFETSKYYRARYETQMKKNEEYMSTIYAPKERQLDNEGISTGPFQRRPARPVLPPSYGEIVR